MALSAKKVLAIVQSENADIDARIDGRIDEKMAEIEPRIDSKVEAAVEAGVSEVSGKVDGLAGEMADVKADVAEISSGVSGLAVDVAGVKADVAGVARRMDGIEDTIDSKIDERVGPEIDRQIDEKIDAKTEEIDRKIDEKIEEVEPAIDEKVDERIEAKTAEIDSRLDGMYTKGEVDDKINKIPKFATKVVDELPIDDISLTTMYLLRSPEGEARNRFAEYFYIVNPETQIGNWEKLGEYTSSGGGEGGGHAVLYVDSLPANLIQTDVVYSVPSESPVGGNGRTEWINPTGTPDGWEMVGPSSFSATPASDTEVDDMINSLDPL